MLKCVPSAKLQKLITLGGRRGDRRGYDLSLFMLYFLHSLKILFISILANHYWKLATLFLSFIPGVLRRGGGMRPLPLEHEQPKQEGREEDLGDSWDTWPHLPTGRSGDNISLRNCDYCMFLNNFLLCSLSGFRSAA